MSISELQDCVSGDKKQVSVHNAVGEKITGRAIRIPIQMRRMNKGKKE